MLTVAYSLRFIYAVFFGPAPSGLPRTPHEPPVLILDDDTTVAGTKQIVAWAKANQAGAPSPKPAA